MVPLMIKTDLKKMSVVVQHEKTLRTHFGSSNVTGQVRVVDVALFDVGGVTGDSLTAAGCCWGKRHCITCFSVCVF